MYIVFQISRVVTSRTRIDYAPSVNFVNFRKYIVIFTAFSHFQHGGEPVLSLPCAKILSANFSTENCENLTDIDEIQKALDNLSKEEVTLHQNIAVQ